MKITEICWNCSQGDEEFIPLYVMEGFFENIQIY
jgi:hypothetical protein